MRASTTRRLDRLEAAAGGGALPEVLQRARCALNVYWPEDEGRPDCPRYTCWDSETGATIELSDAEARAVWRRDRGEPATVTVDWGDDGDS